MMDCLLYYAAVSPLPEPSSQPADDEEVAMQFCFDDAFSKDDRVARHLFSEESYNGHRTLYVALCLSGPNSFLKGVLKLSDVTKGPDRLSRGWCHSSRMSLQPKKF